MKLYTVFQMISDHFWSEALEFYCQHIHRTHYLLSQWLIDFQPYYLSSLPTFSFQWWPRSYGRKRTANWMGFGSPSRRSLWLRPEPGSLVSPELAAAPASGAALCYFYLQNSVHTLQEPELLPLHSSQHQSKSTFCTKCPARQSHFITFPLSSCWLPAGKSRLHLISRFEGIFLVYFHTGLDSNISYPGTCCATNLKTDFPQKSVKSSASGRHLSTAIEIPDRGIPSAALIQLTSNHITLLLQYLWAHFNSLWSLWTWHYCICCCKILSKKDSLIWKGAKHL